MIKLIPVIKMLDVDMLTVNLPKRRVSVSVKTLWVKYAHLMIESKALH